MRLQRTFAWYEAVLIAARTLDFIRERDPKRPNSGEGVEYLQRETGNAPPDSWCCSYACRVYHKTFGALWTLKRSGACEVVRQAYQAAGALITHADAMVRYRELAQLHAAAATGDQHAVAVLAQAAAAGEAGAVDLTHFGAGWQFFSVAALKDAKGTPYLHAHHTGFVGQLVDSGAIRAFLATGGFITTEGNAADPLKAPSDNGDGVYSGRERGSEATKRLYHFGRPELL